jgi:hypothetical protein
MHNGLYSDPFLKRLIDSKPELANEFFETIADSEFVLQDIVLKCLEVPGWVLEKALLLGYQDSSSLWTALEACRHPNFPAHKFQDIIDNQDILQRNYRAVLSYPHINKSQINQLMKNQESNIRGLALAHPLGDPKELLIYLRDVLSSKSEKDFSFLVICKLIILSEEIFTYLFSVQDIDLFHGTIGQALWTNPTLNEEQKTFLKLSEINPCNCGPSCLSHTSKLGNFEILLNYWDGTDVIFISSLPYLQMFKADYGLIFDSMNQFNPEISKFFTTEGHHFSSLLFDKSVTEIKITSAGLSDLNSLTLMNRLFWTELCERSDFEIFRRNGYRVDDVFISHPILGREFENDLDEDCADLGGVFTFGHHKWLLGEDELSFERAAELLIPGESISEAVAEQSFDELKLGQLLIASAVLFPELAQKFGFELNSEAEEWMASEASWIADPEDYEVSASLNPDFKEILSWRKLPNDNKKIIFNFFSLGLNLPESKLKNNSIHFLACMALHDQTPPDILSELSKLNESLINEVLTSRAS